MEELNQTKTKTKPKKNSKSGFGIWESNPLFSHRKAPYDAKLGSSGLKGQTRKPSGKRARKEERA